MKASERTRFERLYQRHLRALKLQGMSDNTIACRQGSSLAVYIHQAPQTGAGVALYTH